MKAIFCFFVTLFLAAPSQALEQSSFRVEGDKFIVYKIDGQFPIDISGKTDVLFVMDNSGSMSPHQELLSKHIEVIVDQALKTKNDFHIGVTSTSDQTVFPYSKGILGHLLGDIKVLTTHTPDLQTQLRNNLLLGAEGSGTEFLFSPIVSALTEPLISTLNKGFYRSEADLAIVFVTDTEDQSQLSSIEVSEFLFGLKKRPSKIILQAIMVTIEDIEQQSCKGENLAPIKVTELIDFYNGDIFSLCSENYVENLSSIGSKIFPEPKGDYAPGIVIDELAFEQKPDPNTIQVRFGNQTLVSGPDWNYDAGQNKIIFSKNIQWQPQEPGTLIEVQFQEI